MSGQDNFLPTPNRLGVHPQVYTSGSIGGANFLGGATPLTANSTTIFRLGPVANVSQFSRLVASATTVPADADGTIIARAFRYNAVTDTAVQVSADLNLEALVTREGLSALPLGTLTAATLNFNLGDTLEVHVINNSAAIDTQPVGLVFTVEMLALR